MRRARFQVSPTARSHRGQSVVALGLRVGYWPCLQAPFVQVVAGTRRIDLWYGLPSYRRCER